MVCWRGIAYVSLPAICLDLDRGPNIHELADITMLTPTQPTQVLALAGNYRSHLQDDIVPPKFSIPQPFYKSPSCLIAAGESIVIPRCKDRALRGGTGCCDRQDVSQSLER